MNCKKTLFINLCFNMTLKRFDKCNINLELTVYDGGYINAASSS